MLYVSCCMYAAFLINRLNVPLVGQNFCVHIGLQLGLDKEHWIKRFMGLNGTILMVRDLAFFSITNS